MFVNDIPSHMSFNQFDNYEQEIWIEDIEGDSFDLTRSVLTLADSPVSPSPFFKVTQTADSHKWLLSFLPNQFTQIPTATSSITSYKVQLSVDDNKSTAPATTYTITAAINNENHKPTLKSSTVTKLAEWTVGHPPTISDFDIKTSLFEDIDPSTTLAFDMNSCTLA